MSSFIEWFYYLYARNCVGNSVFFFLLFVVKIFELLIFSYLRSELSRTFRATFENLHVAAITVFELHSVYSKNLCIPTKNQTKLSETEVDSVKTVPCGTSATLVQLKKVKTYNMLHIISEFYTWYIEIACRLSLQFSQLLLISSSFILLLVSSSEQSSLDNSIRHIHLLVYIFGISWPVNRNKIKRICTKWSSGNDTSKPFRSRCKKRAR